MLGSLPFVVDTAIDSRVGKPEFKKIRLSGIYVLIYNCRTQITTRKHNEK